MSARTSGDAFDLRCDVREKLVDFLQREYPSALPHTRAETVVSQRPGTAAAKQDQPTSVPAP